MSRRGVIFRLVEDFFFYASHIRALDPRGASTGSPTSRFSFQCYEVKGRRLARPTNPLAHYSKCDLDLESEYGKLMILSGSTVVSLDNSSKP
jgi:hypothetical protein